MKKVFVLFFCIILSITLIACGSSQQTTNNSDNSKEKVSELLSEEEFNQMFADPSKYKGDRVDFYAKIFMPPEKDENTTYVQAYADPQNSDKNTIIGIQDTSIDLQDGDIIHVIGIVKDKLEGENAFGAKLVLPMILADSIEKTDYATAFLPPLFTLDVNQEIDQNGYVLNISKIEFAEAETRVYVTVTNNSDDKITFYKFNTNLVQGNKQYEKEDNYAADYPDPQSELLPGITTEGIICFPALDPEAKQLKVISEGRSENYQLKFEPFVFDLTWD